MQRPDAPVARWRSALAVVIAVAPLSAPAVTAGGEGWEHLPASAGNQPGAAPGARAAPADAGKPKTLELRATHINRCPGAGGRVILQDAPCTPLPDPAASAAGVAAGDVVELSALAPRLADESPRPATDTGSPLSLADGALNGAWKLGLLLAGGYGAVRFVLAMRERVHSRRARAAAREGPRSVQHNSH